MNKVWLLYRKWWNKESVLLGIFTSYDKVKNHIDYNGMKKLDNFGEDVYEDYIKGLYFWIEEIETDVSLYHTEKGKVI